MAKRRCSTGRVRAILVEEFDPPVKLFVRTTWGRLNDLQQDMAATTSDAENIPLLTAFLESSLKDWEGVTDEAGEPVAYSPEALRELDKDDVLAFIGAVQTMGEAGSGDPLPETVSEAGSEEPPAS